MKKDRMKTLDEYVKQHKRVAVLGHVRPDGDSVGSVSGVFRYLSENHPELSVTAFLSDVPKYLGFLLSDVPYNETDGEGEAFDLAIAVDVSSIERMGAGKQAFLTADHRVVIDHHETNTGFGEENHILPEASSAAEVVADLMDPGLISLSTATKLYTGIIQDSGVFRYHSTGPNTLRVSAMLLEKGVDFSRIIEETVINQPYAEMKIMARVLEESVLYRDDRFIYGIATTELQEKYGVTSHDLGNVVVELNAVAEADVALFLYQYEDGNWKASLRTKCGVNVAKIAGLFSGGGHSRAAGFSFSGDPVETAERVRLLVREARKA